MDFLNNLNISQNQLLNAALHNFAETPDVEIASPKAGLIGIYNGTVYYYTGTGWVTLALGGVVSSLKNTVENIQKYFAEDTDEADTKINKWNEIVDFLNATEGDTLDDILATKANGTNGIANEAAKVSNSLHIGDFEYNGSQNIVVQASDIAGMLDLKSIYFDVNQNRLFTYSPYGNVAPSFDIRGMGAVTLTTATETNKYIVKISVATASQSSYGVVKLHYSDSTEGGLAVEDKSTVAGRYYGVGIDAAGKLFVNVPWTDSSTTSLAWSAITDKPTTLEGYGITDAVKATSLKEFKVSTGEDTVVTYSPTTGATLNLAAGTGIAFEVSTANNGITIKNTYELPVATDVVLGGIKASYHTTGVATIVDDDETHIDEPTIVARSTVARRYYGVETDVNGYAFVNVPWTDTVYNLTAAAIKAADPTLTRKYTETLTAGEIEYKIEHGLGTTDVSVSIYDPDGNLVLADVKSVQTDEGAYTVYIYFSAAQEVDYTAVIIG